LSEAECLKGDDPGGNGGCANNLHTFPGLLAPFCWTDYGSGTGAGLVAINSDRARRRIAANIARHLSRFGREKGRQVGGLKVGQE